MNRAEFIYLLPYILSVVLSAGILIYAWPRRQVKGAGAYLWVLAGETFWTLFYIIELLSPTLQGKLFWDGLEWVASGVTIVAFPVFAARFAERKWRKGRLLFALSLIVPSIFILLLSTDPATRLFRAAPQLNPAILFSEVEYTLTPATLGYSLYGYLMVLTGIGILFNRLLKPHTFFRAQVLTIIAGILIPILGTALALVGVQILPWLNPLPITIAIGNLVIAWGLFRFRIFEIVPVGRDKVFEEMADPVVILDNKHIIVDINRAMLDLMGAAASEVIGRSAKDIFADFPIPIKMYTDVSYARAEASFPVGNRMVFYELSIWPLYNQVHEITGRVYISHDITAMKELEKDLRNLNQVLEQRVDARTHELAEAYDTTLEGWARTLELRDKETEGHSRRVTETTLTVARALDIPEEDLVHIRRGAILHDIGKMAIPDDVLLKDGQLTETEMETIRQHPAIAYEFLERISFLKKALDIPYCHHEKWDGSGYPRGLKGRAIPLAARIFAVVDVWDAIQSERPYKKAWSRQDAIKHLHEQSGKYFDPQVVDRFLNLVEEGKI